jgi:Gnt-I system high-affinity gluconate transporter/Gnt-II system L-idonate transporter
MALLLSILLLLVLIAGVRLNAFLALLITALFAGLVQGMAPLDLLKTIQNGLGSTLGGLVMVLALGIMLGSILAETGAIQIIASRLLSWLGARNAPVAILTTGFVVGIAMFYNAGFVVLAPLVFAMSANAGQPLVPLTISMAAPLSVAHGFLPPHPGATAVAHVFGADLGKTLLLGLLIALPTIVVAGIFFPQLLRGISANPPALYTPTGSVPTVVPGFFKSLLVALLPVIIMAAAAIAEINAMVLPWLKFAGDPGMAMLLAVLLALLLFGRHRLQPAEGRIPTSKLLEKSGVALGAAASLLLIIGAGGAFKQVLVDSGIGQNLATSLAGVSLSPLLLGWGAATVLRIAVGSATVAGMTAAGVVQPLMAGGGVSPELMTLAIGAGSLMCSHVNDTGFWMFKEWFGLSLRDTFRSWTAMETIVGIMGLLGVLVLDWLL